MKAVSVVIFLFWSVGVMAQDSKAKVTERTFADELGRAVRISMYQPVAGIFKALDRLDEQNLISKDTKWFPFYSSDVWVFFLGDLSEVGLLPSDIQQVVENNQIGEETAFYRYDLILSGERKVQLRIVNMALLEGVSEEQVLCWSSQSIYRAIEDIQIRPTMEPFDVCVE